jgi:hypothetical protein
MFRYSADGVPYRMYAALCNGNIYAGGEVKKRYLSAN